MAQSQDSADNPAPVSDVSAAELTRVEIRGLRLEDQAAVEAITAEAFRGVSIDEVIEQRFGPLRPLSWQTIKSTAVGAEVREQAATCFVAELDGEVIGYITTAVSQRTSTGRIPNIGIARGYRGLGLGTRLIEYLGEHRKHYRATIRLGVRTDTDDAEGAVVAEAPVPPLSAGQIEQALAAFRGAVTQVPPAFSAVKVGGVTAHRAARRGEPVEMAAREVTVHTLTVEDWQSPLLQVALSVSTGTYVRAIARDLGAQLGCGGHVTEMRRTGIGPVDVAQAHSPADIEAAFAAGHGWDLAAPLVRFFEHWPRVIPSAAQRGKLLNGQAVPLPVAGTEAGRPMHALVVDRVGAPIAVLVPEAGWPERWRPTKVLIGQS